MLQPNLAALCVTLGVLASPPLLFAQQPERPAVTVGILKEGVAPSIDGRVDDEVWSTVAPYSTFTQQEPDEGAPASERTEIKFLADRKNLYISVIAFDREPDKIIVTQSRRDADLNDTDSIQILLDTFNDGRNAFVFGTNPFAIEHDGQVMNEGQTSGQQGRAGAGGSQGGQVGGYNANWDADWTVHAEITSRGWEAEFSIPFKTLRYKAGQNQTWGVNALRIIRRRNEMAFLAPVPRGYNIHRVSVAGKLNGLSLPTRRQLQLIPFGVSSIVDNKTVQTKQVTKAAEVGFDMKWGVTSTMTLDATVNTDFAQVEADEQQINLTRFPLFFPEKRPFFLENAQTFQFGQPQSVDLFFSRRIGIGANGAPVPIVGGARLSGKMNGYNIGVLNMQTESALDERTNAVLAPTNNFSVVRVVREVGRSSIGAMFVNRSAFGKYALANDYNRGYGADVAWQATTNGKLFAFFARTDSPTAKGGSDQAGRVFYNYANPLMSGSFGYSQVGNGFNPEVGFLARKNYRRIEGRGALTYDPKRWDWIRRIAPHTFFNGYWNKDDGELATFDGHWHPFSIELANGGRFGWALNTAKDRPRRPFTAFSDVTGRTVIIQPGDYSWAQNLVELITNQSAPVALQLRQLTGSYYNGDYIGWNATVIMRASAKLTTSIAWNRDKISLPQGRFTNDLIPIKVNYSFTRFASMEGLLQYNSQVSTFSSNLRLALLNRSGTGLFVVYNNQQETSSRTPASLLGRSFIIKLSRLFDL